MARRGPAARSLGWRDAVLQETRHQAAHALAELQRAVEQQGRAEAGFQCRTRRGCGRAAPHLFLDDVPADVEQLAVLHARRAGGLAVAAGEAAVEVELGLGSRRRALEDLLHEVDAAARRI